MKEDGHKEIECEWKNKEWKKCRLNRNGEITLEKKKTKTKTEKD